MSEQSNDELAVSTDVENPPRGAVRQVLGGELALMIKIVFWVCPSLVHEFSEYAEASRIPRKTRQLLLVTPSEFAQGNAFWGFSNVGYL